MFDPATAGSIMRIRLSHWGEVCASPEVAGALMTLLAQTVAFKEVVGPDHVVLGWALNPDVKLTCEPVFKRPPWLEGQALADAEQSYRDWMKVNEAKWEAERKARAEREMRVAAGLALLEAKEAEPA